MKKEISAGGIVVRKRHHGWNVLVLRDMNGVWTFPKGKIKRGETIEKAARREIQEEVGLSTLTLFIKLPIITYLYKKNGLISKRVHYFIFQFDGNEPLTNQSEEGIHDAQWMTIDEAINTIGYPNTNKELLEKTKHFLWKLRPHRI